MATTTRSQLQGFAELDRVLKALPGRLAERELTSAVRAGANVIRKEARARAPRGGVLAGVPGPVCVPGGRRLP